MSTQKQRQTTEEGQISEAQPDQSQQPWTNTQKSQFKDCLFQLLKEGKLGHGTESSIITNLGLAVDMMSGMEDDFKAYQH